MLNRLLKRIIILSLVPAIALISFYWDQKNEINFFFERKLVDMPTLTGGYEIQSAKPERIYMRKDTVYIYDMVEQRIKEYADNGKLISIIRGDSLRQKEFGLVTSYEAEGDMLEIADGRNKGIFSYSEKEGTLHFDTIGSFSQAIALGNKNFLLSCLDPSINEMKFKLYNLGDKQLKTVRTPLLEYRDGGFANDGFFKKHENTFLYVFYNLGRFLVFDSSLKSFRSFQTIDKYETLPITIKERNRIYISSKTITINGNAATDGTNVYIISLVRSNTDKSSRTKGTFIDVYDLSSGTYRYSFVLKDMPGKVRDISVAENILYVLTGNSVKMFKL
jgi:hypothetical protein